MARKGGSYGSKSSKGSGSKGGYGPASRTIPKQPTPHNPIASKRPDKY
jgi:hypothetical protein